MASLLPEPRKGWHRGENTIHDKLSAHVPTRTATQGWTWYTCGLEEEHRVFNCTRISFAPLTTLDAHGRPWVSIVCGKDGRKGFVSSPNELTLLLDVCITKDDPLEQNVTLAASENDACILVAGLGIEPVSRTRVKFAGSMLIVQEESDGQHQLKITINQSIGNCPKYITSRELEPFPPSPHTVYRVPALKSNDRLPEDVIAFILSSETSFLGTTYSASETEKSFTPSHLGLNHRGGRAGFVRVRNDGRTLVLPDYSGDWLLTSLGNIEATPLAGITFVSFVTGDVLQLTGEATNFIGAAAHALMPLQDRLTTIAVTGFTLIRGALAVRQSVSFAPERSPYSPPVRYLAEEPVGSALFGADDDDAHATLVAVRLHSNDLATFVFEASRAIAVRPGQAAVLDFSALVGRVEWSHMRDADPQGLNDDRVRTWTIARADAWAPAKATRFELAMREKEGGVVTGALFTIIRKARAGKPALLDDARILGIKPRLLGIGGDFVLPEVKAGARMLWVAGGIGVTPFLAMLSAFAGRAPKPAFVHLILATREPDVLMGLIWDAISMDEPPTAPFDVLLDVFTSNDSNAIATTPQTCSATVTLRKHLGRIPDAFFEGDGKLNADDVFLCGPEEFESNMVKVLVRAGMTADKVRRESFEY